MGAWAGEARFLPLLTVNTLVPAGYQRLGRQDQLSGHRGIIFSDGVAGRYNMIVINTLTYLRLLYVYVRTCALQLRFRITGENRRSRWLVGRLVGRVEDQAALRQCIGFQSTRPAMCSLLSLSLVSRPFLSIYLSVCLFLSGCLSVCLPRFLSLSPSLFSFSRSVFLSLPISASSFFCLPLSLFLALPLPLSSICLVSLELSVIPLSLLHL